MLDQGLPPRAAVLLRAAGWDAIHVRELGMAAASDADVFKLASLEARVCVTLDTDFHALLARHGSRNPSVILIRREGLDAPAVAQLLMKVCVTSFAWILPKGSQ